ncbi:MAG: hypothetical protein Fur0035_12290 [Anaerolineales bacterium]
MNKFFLLLGVALLTACAPVIPPTIVPATAPAVSAACPFQTAESTLAAPPTDLYGKQPLTGMQTTVGDFVFQLWLYCDPNLQSDGQGAAYSAIPGLGLFASWRYNGPQVSGKYGDFYGFEPDIFTGTSMDGPLYRARSGYISGITVSAEDAQKHLEQATPFLYHVGVQTPSGKKETIFSFTVTLQQDTYHLSAVTEKP